MQQEIIEVKGATIEIATRTGLEKLNLPRERVEVEVLDAGSRGLLGIGSRDAVVRLKVRPTIEQIIQQDYGEVTEKEVKVKAAPVKQEVKRDRRERQKTKPKKRQEKVVEQTAVVEPVVEKVAEQPEAKETKKVTEVKAKKETVRSAPKKKRSGRKSANKRKKSDDWDQPPTDVAGMQAEVDMGISVVATLLEKMDIAATVTGEISEPSDDRDQPIVVIHINGEDLGNVIGERGETVNDLQYLARLIASHELHYRTKFVIDVGGYRDRRRQALARLAERMADKVVKQNRPFTLEPMPPYERRVVHLTLRQHEEVETSSIGQGDRRRVRIYPKNSSA